MWVGGMVETVGCDVDVHQLWGGEVREVRLSFETPPGSSRQPTTRSALPALRRTDTPREYLAFLGGKTHSRVLPLASIPPWLDPVHMKLRKTCSIARSCSHTRSPLEASTNHQRRHSGKTSKQAQSHSPPMPMPGIVPPRTTGNSRQHGTKEIANARCPGGLHGVFRAASAVM